MAKTLKEHNFFGFDATIVADSKNTFGDRLTTMIVTLPRIVLAEAKTHRIFSDSDGEVQLLTTGGLGFNDEDYFSRNSASSRAIPFKKMLERVKTNPYIPLAWQQDHKGMQGSEYITKESLIRSCEEHWLRARDHAINIAEGLTEGLNVTKQIANRLLEPFLWHTIIVSSTEWENFFSLRCPQYEDQTPIPDHDPYTYHRSRKDWLKGHPGYSAADNFTIIDWLQINKSQADIHIQFAAEAMWDAMNESEPKQLKEGEWHIPFGDEIGAGSDEIDDMFTEFVQESSDSDGTFNEPYISNIKRKIAIAQCARLSYGNIDPNANYEADIKLYERLVSMKHASPPEHTAQAMTFGQYFTFYKGKANTARIDAKAVYITVESEQNGFGWCRNFRGFIQERYNLNI